MHLKVIIGIMLTWTNRNTIPPIYPTLPKQIPLIGRLSELSKITGSNKVDSDAHRKLHEEYSTVRHKLADAESRVESTEKQLAEAKADREYFHASVGFLTHYADRLAVGIVGKDKLDMLNEVKETNSTEITKMREDWNSFQHKIRELEAKFDLSQSVVREVSSERDSLREVLSKKEIEIDSEDKAALNEMRRLLGELSGKADDGREISSSELLKQFVETTERSTENLAKRAEVSAQFLHSVWPTIKSYILPFSLIIEKSKPFHLCSD